MPDNLLRDGPVEVSIIGTGDGAITSGTVGVTPPDQPNVVVHVVGPLRAICIRFVNVYLTSLTGLIGAGSLAPKLIPALDFLSLVGTCASLSLGVAGLALLKDCVTVLGKLEQKFPLLTGSI